MKEENFNEQLKTICTYDPLFTQMFEEITSLCKDKPFVELCMSLMIKDVLRCINYHKYKIPYQGIIPPDRARIKELTSIELMMIAGFAFYGWITRKTASHLIEKAFVEKEFDMMKYLKEKGLLIDAKIDLSHIVKQIIINNKPIVDDYRTGNKKALNSLIGLVMKEVKGNVDGQEVRKVLLEELT